MLWDLKLKKQDYIDINNLSSIKELIDFLNEVKDDAFCKNCNLKERHSQLYDMEHTKYDIYEWFYKEEI